MTSQWGSSQMATNTPEMKYRGQHDDLGDGLAASWLRITEASSGYSEIAARACGRAWGRKPRLGAPKAYP